MEADHCRCDPVVGVSRVGGILNHSWVYFSMSCVLYVSNIHKIRDCSLQTIACVFDTC